MKIAIKFLATVTPLLSVSYSLDYITDMLRKIMQRTYNLTPLIGISLSQILYACILLLLIIVIKKQCTESKLLATLYIAIGFSTTLSMFLYYRFPGLPFSAALLSPSSNLAMAGAFMVAIGVTSMIPFFKFLESGQ